MAYHFQCQWPDIRYANIERNINNKIRARTSTLEVISFVPAWTTLAADCAAEAATRDKRPNPCQSKQNSDAYSSNVRVSTMQVNNQYTSQKKGWQLVFNIRRPGETQIVHP